VASTRDSYSIEQAEEDIATLRGQVQLLGEIVALTNGPTPNTPASGTVDIFASGGQPNYINAAGLQMGLMGAQNATFPNTTVTQASLTTLASAVVPANDAEVGAVYALLVSGHYTEATGAATSLQLGVSFGGTNDSNQIISTNVAPAGGTGRFRALVCVYCATTGVSGTWRTEVWATVCQNATPSNAVTITDNTGPNALLTKDTTSNQTLALKAAWGTTTGSPSITSDTAVYMRIA
jgi:hypothetical protein